MDRNPWKIIPSCDSILPQDVSFSYLSQEWPSTKRNAENWKAVILANDKCLLFVDYLGTYWLFQGWVWNFLFLFCFLRLLHIDIFDHKENRERPGDHIEKKLQLARLPVFTIVPHYHTCTPAHLHIFLQEHFISPSSPLSLMAASLHNCIAASPTFEG